MLFRLNNRENISKSLLTAIAFLFPIGMGIVQHWSTGLFCAALAVSLFTLGRDWSCPERSARDIFIAFALFFCVSALSLVNAEDLSAGVRRLEKMLFLLFSFPLYLAIRRLKTDLTLPLLSGFVVAGPIMAVAAVYFIFVQNLARADGHYSAIIFGNTAMLTALVVLTGLYFGCLSGWYKYLGAFSFLCASYATILSGTRGAWLVLPVMSVIVLYMTIRRYSWRKLLLLTCLILSFLLMLLATEHARDRSSKVVSDLVEYKSGENRNTSVGVRLMLWQQALALWKEDPVIGVGIGSFRYNVEKNIEQQKTQLIRSYSHAHNIFLDALASTGLFGLGGLVIALFIMPALHFLRDGIAATLKNRNFPTLSGLLLLMSFAVFGMTEGWLIHSGMIAVFCFILIVFLSAAPCSYPVRRAVPAEIPLR